MVEKSMHLVRDSILSVFFFYQRPFSFTTQNMGGKNPDLCMRIFSNTTHCTKGM